MDGDTLTYTNTLLAEIDVDINAENVVTFTPISTFYGTATITFFAWDPSFANASSNLIQLEVIQTSTPPPPSPGGGGGGGGGGGAIPSCLPNWYCRPWGPCEPDNFRRRECYDLNNCTTPVGKPNTTEACEFVSTCFDGFKGPEEEGVDCGGPCPPCGTCYDNICNNNEDCTQGLIDTPDCGGPCDACDYPSTETCYDNICNNNEDCVYGLTDIPDCGGPCDTCPEVEQPTIAERFNWIPYVLILMFAGLLAYILHRSYPNLMRTFKRRRRQLYEERLLLEAKISESIFDSLLKLEAALDSEAIEKLILLYSTIVRRYFKNLFDLGYEFTYDELITEIRKRTLNEMLQGVLIGFFNRSLELEFSGKSVSKPELKAMISEFKQLVSYTSHEPYLQEEKAKKQKEKLNKIDTMFMKISEAESLLRRQDLNGAYFIYRRLVADFKLLSESDKKKLHGFVARLYDEIRLARERWQEPATNK